MPFKSKAQQRFAYGTKQPWAKEFSQETKKLKKGKKKGFAALPERVKKAQQPLTYEQKKKYAKNRYKAGTATAASAGGVVGGFYGASAMEDAIGTSGAQVPRPKMFDPKYKKASAEYATYNAAREKHYAAYNKERDAYDFKSSGWNERRKQWDASHPNNMDVKTQTRYNRLRDMADKGATQGERDAFGAKVKEFDVKYGNKPFTEPPPVRPKPPKPFAMKDPGVPARAVIKHPVLGAGLVGGAAVGGALGISTHLSNRRKFKQRFGKSHEMSAFGVNHY